MVHSNPGGKQVFSYHSLEHGLETMVQQEGWRSLYKGLIPSFLGISHVAVQFPLYEQLKLFLQTPNAPISSMDLLLASSISKLVASTVTYPHEVFGLI